MICNILSCDILVDVRTPPTNRVSNCNVIIDPVRKQTFRITHLQSNKMQFASFLFAGCNQLKICAINILQI